MNRRQLPTYAATAACALFAAGRAGAQAPAGTPGRNSGKEYALKNVSSFTPPATDSRNPFWPIGWTPSAPVAAAAPQAPVVDVRADQFTVTSISIDSAGALAVINGQVKAIGERILVPGGSPGVQTFVSVKKITDGMVTLDYKGHELLVTPSGTAGTKKK